MKLVELRALAIARAFFPETTLARAIARLGFVQADPIRAPATAQDLILRHRVRGYRQGDLERGYARLAVEEDYLYAYGFLPRAIAYALHPRPRHRRDRAGPGDQPLTSTETRVLAAVRELGRAHPSLVASAVAPARRTIVNAWGGQSRATTHALERLHRRGLVRVARRDRGVRVYELAPAREPAARDARLRVLVRAIASVLSPVLERTLRANVARFRHLGDPRAAIDALVREGALTRSTADGASYLHALCSVDEVGPTVRFLAPFDPLVWDRRRFEHFWGWAYRFEAYTPKARRIRGYYALPILYGDHVVGWANVTKDGAVDLGFATRRPRERPFETALEEEIVRIRTFVAFGKPVQST